MTLRSLFGGFGFLHAGVLGAAVLCGSALGCSLHPIPASLSPREMVLPYLKKECLSRVPQSPPVKVTKAGAAPLQQLRFVHRPQEVSIQLTQKPFSRPDYVVETEFVDLGARGQGCHTFEVHGVKTLHIGDPVVGVAKVGVRGETSFATDALDTKSYQVERDLAWALDRTDPVLPEQAVGVGAEWQVRTEAQRSGEVVEIEASYRLTKLQGTRVTLEVVRRVHRPAQRIRGPQGYSKKVEDLTSHERGVLDFDLRSRPIPNGRFWNDKGQEVMRIDVAYRAP